MHSRSIVCFTSILVASGCAPADGVPPATEASDTDTETGTTADTGLDTGPDTGSEFDRPAAGAWIEVAPGGATGCALGGDFRFYVRGGDPQRLVLDFAGGGACWDQATCGGDAPIYKTDVKPMADHLEILDLDFIGGFQEVHDPEHPSFGATYVHIPYCTGDLHLGDVTVDYGDGVVIAHRGATNVRSVIDWLAPRYPAAAELTVTGCSAGSYAAYFHTPTLVETFPQAQLRVLGDAGIGVVVDGFVDGIETLWGVSMPVQVSSLKPGRQRSTADLFAGVAETYPDHRFALHSTAFDYDQTFFFAASGGDGSTWPALAREQLNQVRGRADNLRYVLTPGPTHCITPYEHLWSRTVDDVSLADWLSIWHDSDTLPDDLVCDGDACRNDDLCASCEPNDFRSFCDYCLGWTP